MRIFSNILFDISLLFELSIAVNKVDSKHSQISRSLVNFQGKILVFKMF